jgi:small neutral amino acid transporter SnatA (MarC family)
MLGVLVYLGQAAGHIAAITFANTRGAGPVALVAIALRRSSSRSRTSEKKPGQRKPLEQAYYQRNMPIVQGPLKSQVQHP